jgi:adenylate kinase
VGDLIKEGKFYEGRDEELDTHILDEDKLLDAMEAILDQAAEEGQGIVADYHACEIFPERWFDLVLVLRTNTDILFDRLTTRGYNEKKRSENMESEIMQIVLEEARESYAQEIVHEVQSNKIEDMDANVERAKQWYEQWAKDNGHVKES